MAMNERAGKSQADGFLNGRIELRQADGGHRAGTDAVLLAAATPPDEAGLILDAGAGVGAVGLMAATLAPAASIGLIEIEPGACALARENVAGNGFLERALVFEADLLDPAARRAAGLADEQADLVLTNPPFLAAGRVRKTPDAKRALAHVAAAPLGEWVRCCLALLASGGVFVMIHRADALSECLASVEGRLGGVAVLPVLPRAGEAATRILLRGKKGSKAPLALLAPLVLHEADGRFTERAEAIFRGGEGVVWRE
jgi:tRNA1(Val) A37 N6-methylase TrmN6